MKQRSSLYLMGTKELFTRNIQKQLCTGHKKLFQIQNTKTQPLPRPTFQKKESKIQKQNTTDTLFLIRRQGHATAPPVERSRDFFAQGREPPSLIHGRVPPPAPYAGEPFFVPT